MEHVIEFLIGIARVLITIIGYGSALIHLIIAIFGVIHDWKAEEIDRETVGGVALLLAIVFMISLITTIALRVTA